MKRSQMITVSDALRRILENAIPLESQPLPVENALTYTVTGNIVSDRPIPPFNRVAMDGFAVKSSDFISPSINLTIKGKVQTGVENDLTVKSGETIQVMTGAPCPGGADAIVKVENSVIAGNKVTLTEKAIRPGLNIARKGEDADEGKILIDAGTPLTTAGIAICASVGMSEVEVYKKPKISIMSTGTEIIPPHRTPLPYQIRDCNSFTLRTMCGRMDLETEFLGIAEDDTSVISDMIRKGLESDILILSGGVSMGEFDHVPKLLSENGVEKIFHQVKVKPGKPLWFGKTNQNTFVFGLPGNPVSVQTCFRIFVEPFIKKLSGQNSPEHLFLHLPLLTDVVSRTPREHYMPGRFVTSVGRTFA